MLLELDSHGGVPIYRQVMDQVRRQILTGVLTDGDQLESVSSLSARLKVNPMTISKAYGFLVEEGVLERRRGVGLFVKSMRKDTRRREQNRLLENALEKAAALTAQMKIPEEEAVRLFLEQYRRLDSSSHKSRKR